VADDVAASLDGDSAVAVDRVGGNEPREVLSSVTMACSALSEATVVRT